MLRSTVFSTDALPGKVLHTALHPSFEYMAVGTSTGWVELLPLLVEGANPDKKRETDDRSPVQLLRFNDNGDLFHMKRWELTWQDCSDPTEPRQVAAIQLNPEEQFLGDPSCVLVSHQDLLIGTSAGYVLFVTFLPAGPAQKTLVCDGHRIMKLHRMNASVAYAVSVKGTVHRVAIL